MARNRPDALHTAARTLDRRRFLALGASAGTVALAGCSAIADFIAGFVLQDVNVFNGTDTQITGSIEIVDPNDELALDESFDLKPGSDGTGDGGGGNDEAQQSAAVYNDVLSDSGQYQVSIELDEGSAVEGQRTASKTVEVSKPDDQHLFVFVGASESSEPITIGAVEGLSDIEELTNE